MSLNWKGARAVERSPLEGELVRLEPVDPARHGRDLFEASRHADGHLDLPRVRAVRVSRNRSPNGSKPGRRRPTRCSMPWSIAKRAPRVVWRATCGWRLATVSIEIGHIWFAPPLQRTRQATEAIFLLARHAFDDLGYRRLEWKCDSLNAPSRRAAERFGFTYEGIFRQHMVIKDRNRDTAWFSIIDGEWPSAQSRLRAVAGAVQLRLSTESSAAHWPRSAPRGRPRRRSPRSRSAAGPAEGMRCSGSRSRSARWPGR